MSNVNSVDRRQFLHATGAATLAAAAGCAGAGPKPNILWIIGEDFSPELSCYGETTIETPRIDKLATEGVLFENAICTAPVCSAARSALLVGMYQTSVGGHQHRSHRKPEPEYLLPEPVRPFTHILREAGYHTSNLRDRHGLKGTGKTDFNYKVEQPYDSDDWSDRAEGQPFYAQINFSETHRSFDRFPNNPVDPADVKLPPYYPDHPAVREDWAAYMDDTQHLDAKVGKVLDRLEEEGLAEDTIVVFMSDHGRAMPRGKQFLYEAGIRIPFIVRIPEKFRPAGFEVGAKTAAQISHIDLTAQTLEWAEAPIPEYMEGRPIFDGGAVNGREFTVSARDRCDETVDRIRCVRTPEYKYIRNFMPERAYTQQNIYKDTSYPILRVLRDLHAEGKLTPEQALFMAETRPEEEFYDLKADPHELNNLAGSEEHAERKTEFAERLDAWIAETGDYGETPEDPLPAEYDRRSQHQGWSTNAGQFHLENGAMRFHMVMPKGSVNRTIVAEGGDLGLRLRIKTESLKPVSASWGAIGDMRNPEFKAELDIPTDGKWHETVVPFTIDGWLGAAGLQFEGQDADAEIAAIELLRKSGSGWSVEQSWRFA